MRKSEPAKPESLFEAATSDIAMRSPSPIPKREAKRPTAEVASSAIAKTPEASEGAQPDRRNEPPKPECNVESTTSRIAPVVGRPIAKAGEPGTQPNGRNERPKPECNLESMTSRIAHVVGRPIAKAGETGTEAQPDRRNEPPRPGSADLGCKSAALRLKERNPPSSLEAETPRPLTACWITLPSQPGLPVAKSELLHCRSLVACNLPVYSAPPTEEFGIFDWQSLRSGCFGPERRGHRRKKMAKTDKQSHYVAWNQLLSLKNKPKTKPNQSH